jgi:hypothetical protein
MKDIHPRFSKKRRSLKYRFLLDDASKVIDRLRMILAVASLVCLLVGTHYNGQISAYLSQSAQPAYLLGFVTTVTMNSTTSTTTAGCGPYVCSYSTSWTIGASLSNFTLPTPLQEAQANAATAWNLKLTLDFWGAVGLIVFLALSTIRWLARKISF